MTNAMIKANPDLLAIHPLDALEADEEGILLEHTFMSFFDSYADIPEYTDWMWNTDQVSAYRYLKRMLQFIHWQERPLHEYRLAHHGLSEQSICDDFTEYRARFIH